MSILTDTTDRTGVRDLLPASLFDRLAARITIAEHVDHHEAELIMDDGLAFLRDCAVNPEQRLSPSPRADLGWHTFILFTKDYAEFCQRIAGRFIHHVPTGDNATDCDSKCHQCHAGCYDSP